MVGSRFEGTYMVGTEVRLGEGDGWSAQVVVYTPEGTRYRTREHHHV